MRARWWTSSAIVAATFALSSGCAAAPPAPTPRLAAAGGDVALVQTAAGLAGVPVGSSEPTWVRSGAVAAPDGSAVFDVRPAPSAGDQEVVRVDPRSGDVRVAGRIAAPEGTRVAAVEPGGGRRVVLTRPDGPSTTVFDYDTEAASLVGVRTYEGELAPEAYSSDRGRLFAARIYRDRYHVHILDLVTGHQFPTFGPDKTRPPEDMYGDVVQAALSPDGHHLATLYRDRRSPDHTAFVHLLSLADGLTICVDLHEPFGTDVAGADAIEWRGTTIAVGHAGDGSGSPTLATFDAAGWAMAEPRDHYHADVFADPDVAVPVVPDGVADVPAFQRFIALAG